MTSARVVVWLLLGLLVAVPAGMLASGGTGDGQAHSAQWQHAKRSGTAWRNFSNALVVDVPVVVPSVDHPIVTSELLASFIPVAAPIFVPPRG